MQAGGVRGRRRYQQRMRVRDAVTLRDYAVEDTLSTALRRARDVARLIQRDVLVLTMRGHEVHRVRWRRCRK